MKWLLPIVLVVAVAAGVLLLTRGDDQTRVVVRPGDAIPSDLNRSDDYGADTLKAYLTAAVDCDERAIARYGTPLEDVVALCQARPDEVTGEAARDELDGRGRALWRLSADGGDLPDEYFVRIAQESGTGWFVEGTCSSLERC